MIRQQRDSSQVEFSDADYAGDLQEISGIKNTDETLVSVAKTLTTIEKEISNMYDAFQVRNSSDVFPKNIIFSENQFINETKDHEIGTNLLQK